jgi:hypothetical protein
MLNLFNMASTTSSAFSAANIVLNDFVSFPLYLIDSRARLVTLQEFDLSEMSSTCSSGILKHLGHITKSAFRLLLTVERYKSEISRKFFLSSLTVADDC